MKRKSKHVVRYLSKALAVLKTANGALSSSNGKIVEEYELMIQKAFRITHLSSELAILAVIATIYILIVSREFTIYILLQLDENNITESIPKSFSNKRGVKHLHMNNNYPNVFTYSWIIATCLVICLLSTTN